MMIAFFPFLSYNYRVNDIEVTFLKLSDMVRCGICSALMAVCAWLAVPIGDTVITMQTFGVLFSLGYLGGKKGTIACCVYLLLGTMGVPVFAGFQGGIGILLGPTGGYLFGFMLTCLSYWFFERRLPKWLNMAMGLSLCYICGSSWFYFVYTDVGILVLIMKCVVPYLLPDACKLTLALMVSKRIQSY